MSDDAPLNDMEEALYRQVHPSWIREGRVSSQAFRPMPKDEGRLSVDRGSLTSPRDSYVLYTEQRKLQSVGVWSVTVGDCSDHQLSVLSDPIAATGADEVANSAHAIVSFASVSSKGQVEAKGQKLAKLANERGRLFPER